MTFAPNDPGFQAVAMKLIDLAIERDAGTQEEIANLIAECFTTTTGSAVFRHYLTQFLKHCRHPMLRLYLEKAIELRHEKSGPMSSDESEEFIIKMGKAIEELKISYKGW